MWQIELHSALRPSQAMLPA